MKLVRGKLVELWLIEVPKGISDTGTFGILGKGHEGFFVADLNTECLLPVGLLKGDSALVSKKLLASRIGDVKVSDNESVDEKAETCSEEMEELDELIDEQERE